MKKIIAIMMLLMYTSLYAVTTQEIDGIEEDVNHLQTVVDDHYKTILESRIRDAVDILEDYPTDKSELIQQWFYVVNQSSDDLNRIYFIAKTKRKMKFYLEQMLLDTSHPMSQKDFNIVSTKFVNLTKRNMKDGTLTTSWRTTTKSVNLRNLPILSPLTKLSVLDGDIKIEILYTITYVTMYNHTTHWGYVREANSGKRGWVNLKNTQPAQ